MKGDAQAIIGGAGLFGFEVDLSNGKDGFVYTINVTGGKSIGLGIMTMPVRTKATGDLNKIFVPKK